MEQQNRLAIRPSVTCRRYIEVRLICKSAINIKSCYIVVMKAPLAKAICTIILHRAGACALATVTGNCPFSSVDSESGLALGGVHSSIGRIKLQENVAL